MPERNFGTGALRSPRDPRDWLMGAVLPAAPVQIPDADLREGQSPVRNQNGTNGCVAYSIVSMMEYLEQTKEPLSSLGLYYLTRAQEGSVLDNIGTYPRDTMMIAKKWGIPPEALWPEDFSRFQWCPDGADALNAMPSHRIREFRAIDGGLDEMRWSLANGITFTLCFDVPRNFYDDANASRGIMSMPGPEGFTFQGHDVHVVGSKEDTGFEGGGKLIIKNSYGADYHDKGYFYMPWAFAAGPDLWDIWAALK